eukprot:TRINITY_DN46734_c0_g1_i1.p1 TRINITY_DN46734_c0_g1~~TRINITY_DN46734_c0_g1_i1.p1  ORF type:complete len:130 (+),score=21.77 TRINITY_DN46734_c0_g1_i1:103-492(+)
MSASSTTCWKRTSGYLAGGALAGIVGASLGIGGNGIMGFIRQIPIGTYSKYYSDTTLFIIGDVGAVIGASYGMRKMYLLSQASPTNSKFTVFKAGVGILMWAFVMDVGLGIPLPWIVPHGVAEKEEEAT